MNKWVLAVIIVLATGLTFSADLNLTSPAGGERWAIGTPQNITWSEVGVSSSLRLSLLKNDGTIRAIAQNISPGAGSYSWTVGSTEGGTANPGDGFMILIQTMDGSAQDLSGSFSIIRSRPRPSGQAAPRPTIAVASPNGRENWRIGETHSIRWHENELRDSVSVALLKDGTELGLIADDIPAGQRVYNWRVGEALIGGETYEAASGYRIKVMAQPGTPVDTSDATFSISTTQIRQGGISRTPRIPGQEASIRIVSPNGGEHLYSGQTISIRYQTTGTIDRITTWLNQLTPRTYQYRVNTNAPHTGEFNYQIPNVGEGGNFKIKIYGHVSGDIWVEDVSNGPFIIREGLDVTAHLKKLNLKADYGDQNIKDLIIYVSGLVGAVTTLIDWYTLKGLDLEVEFLVENEGSTVQEPDLNVGWQVNIHKDGVHFMGKNGNVALSSIKSSDLVKTVFHMGADVEGLLKVEIILDPAFMLPEADFFRANNIVSQSFSLTHK